MFSWFKPKPQKTLGEIAILNSKWIKVKNKREKDKAEVRSFRSVLAQIEQQIVEERKAHARIDSTDIRMFEDNQELVSELQNFLDDQQLIMKKGSRMTFFSPKRKRDEYI